MNGNSTYVIDTQLGADVQRTLHLGCIFRTFGQRYRQRTFSGVMFVERLRERRGPRGRERSQKTSFKRYEYVQSA